MTLSIEANGPVPEQTVTAIEDAIGVHFPASYRNWMLQNDGGQFRSYVAIPGTSENGLLSEIDRIEKVAGYRELKGTQLVPPEFLVITLGHGGDLALRVIEDDHGSVWWADYEKAQGLAIEGATQEIMHRLADDFESFLASLDVS